MQSVSKQRLSKHVPAEKNARSNRRTVFLLWSAPRSYLEDNEVEQFICRQQAEVILNHDNENVRNIGQGEARHRKYKRLKVGGGQADDRSSV
jgi:hypothetical protein